MTALFAIITLISAIYKHSEQIIWKINESQKKNSENVVFAYFANYASKIKLFFTVTISHVADVSAH